MMSKIIHNGINFYRLGRLALKYTNPLMIAFVLFWVALVWGLWQQNKALKETNQRLETVHQALMKQTEDEANAWLDYQTRLTAQQQQSTERQQRLNVIVQQPEVKASANAPVAPVLKHALNELRKERHESVND